jgi:phospholipid/cholesterol/gamma-HCH transport system permease protein
MLAFVSELGGLSLFLVRIVQKFLRTSGNRGAILAQISSVSYRSLGTIAFAGVFVGAILVLQFNTILGQYDAQSLLGGLNTSTVIRQVGPLIISFLLAGKVGAFTAAELATMRVTEQIDAIECLGTDSIQYLIVPRFVGIVVSSLVLLMLGMMISVAGSIAVASAFCGINPLQYIGSIAHFVGFWSVAGAMIQALIYGIIVGGVACFHGYNATGGARGVGRAVTLAAIYTNFYIVIANFLSNEILAWIGEIGHSALERLLR